MEGRSGGRGVRGGFLFPLSSMSLSIGQGARSRRQHDKGVGRGLKRNERVGPSRSLRVHTRFAFPCFALLAVVRFGNNDVCPVVLKVRVGYIHTSTVVISRRCNVSRLRHQRTLALRTHPLRRTHPYPSPDSGTGSAASLVNRRGSHRTRARTHPSCSKQCRAGGETLGSYWCPKAISSGR